MLIAVCKFFIRSSCRDFGKDRSVDMCSCTAGFNLCVALLFGADWCEVEIQGFKQMHQLKTRPKSAEHLLKKVSCCQNTFDSQRITTKWGTS